MHRLIPRLLSLQVGWNTFTCIRNEIYSTAFVLCNCHKPYIAAWTAFVLCRQSQNRHESYIATRSSQKGSSDTLIYDSWQGTDVRAASSPYRYAHPRRKQICVIIIRFRYRREVHTRQIKITWPEPIHVYSVVWLGAWDPCWWVCSTCRLPMLKPIIITDGFVNSIWL